MCVFRRRSPSWTVATELLGQHVVQGESAKDGILMLIGKRCRGDTTYSLRP